MHIKTDEKKEYFISEVLELDYDAYADYRERMKNLPDEFKQDYNSDVEHLYLLVTGESHEDGIIVDFSGRAYDGIPAFASDAREQLERHIRQLADYCVQEGTDNTENGKWSITYEELYYHFDHTTVSSRNGIGALLRQELQQREEINELIMTEDCIEMTCHLEYCERCGNDPLSLLSVVGCNIYDEHEHESAEHSDEEVPQTFSM